MKAVQAKNIDEYIAGFPRNVQQILEEVRATIRKAAPGAEETISYAIPTFKLNGTLIHFAAYKNHIGLYPAPREEEAFKELLAAYDGGKGTVKFPIEDPIPLSLISKIVKYRLKKNLEKGISPQRRKGATKPAGKG